MVVVWVCVCVCVCVGGWVGVCGGGCPPEMERITTLCPL